MRLVLLPGLDGTEILFGPLVRALPSWIKPLVVTYPDSGPHRYSDLLPLVEEAVAGLDEFYVLGWSFSGPLALMLSVRMAERVRGVILAASFIRLPLRGIAWLRFAVNGPIVGIVRALRRMPLFLPGGGTPEFRRAKAQTWSRVDARVLAARARTVFDVDAREQLWRCPQPLLYVGGSKDTVVPAHNADEIAKERPDARVVTIVGPHLALFTNPAAAVGEIARFIQSCRG